MNNSLLGREIGVKGVKHTNVGLVLNNLVDRNLEQGRPDNGGHRTKCTQPEDEHQGNLALAVHVEARDDGQRHAQHDEVESETAGDLAQSDGGRVVLEPRLHERERDRVDLEQDDEEEEDAPDRDDADDGPDAPLEPGRREDALVKEQHADLDGCQGELDEAGGYEDELC